MDIRRTGIVRDFAVRGEGVSYWGWGREERRVYLFSPSWNTREMWCGECVVEVVMGYWLWCRCDDIKLFWCCAWGMDRMGTFGIPKIYRCGVFKIDRNLGNFLQLWEVNFSVSEFQYLWLGVLFWFQRYCWKYFHNWNSRAWLDVHEFADLSLSNNMACVREFGGWSSHFEINILREFTNLGLS